MNIKKIIKYFERQNVCVVGLKGRGKDLLFANVIQRRKAPYISNMIYTGKNDVNHYPFQYELIDPKNNHHNFITGNINKYIFPYEDGTDIYLSDGGVYFPCQYNNELNRDYKGLPVFMALSRHLGACNVHFNTQNLNRMWDKVREMSDIYILCRGVIYIPFFNIVIQNVRIYDKYESCVQRLPPFTVSVGLLTDKATKKHIEMQKELYQCQNGMIKDGILIYRNISNYDSRRFRTMLGGDDT